MLSLLQNKTIGIGVFEGMLLAQYVKPARPSGTRNPLILRFMGASPGDTGVVRRRSFPSQADPDTRSPGWLPLPLPR